MQSIYNYVTGANHASRVYGVAAVLCLLFMVHVLLISTFNVLNFYIRTLLLLLLLLYDMDVSCHRPFLPGTSLEPAVIPTAQASSFTLQYFPYYV